MKTFARVGVFIQLGAVEVAKGMFVDREMPGHQASSTPRTFGMGASTSARIRQACRANGGGDNMPTGW